MEVIGGGARRLAKACLWGIVALALLTPGLGNAADLLFSARADCSAPGALDGASLSGTTYIFVSPASGIRRVRFYLDDPAHSSARQTEWSAPWDFAGTAADGSALPLAAETLTDGAHTISAVVDLSGGGTETLNATVSVANQAPALQFSTASVSLSAAQGGSPASTSVSLSASDGAGPGYSLSSSAAWLSGSPASGTAPQGLTVSADPAGLAAGTYTATLTASASGYTDASLQVSFTVSSSGGYALLLSHSPDRSSPVALDGQSLSGEVYVFTSPSSGVRQVRFYIDGSLAKTENIAPYDLGGTNSDDSAAPFDTTVLADGSHSLSAQIDLSGGGTETLDASVSVANNVAVPALSFSPGAMTFLIGEGGDSATQPAQLGTSDGTSAAFTLSSTAAWLSASSVSGSAPAALAVTADPAGLAGGTYTGTLTATAAGYSPAQLGVTLSVAGSGDGSGGGYGLQFSTAADRSAPAPLGGATVAGAIHVFVAPQSGIARVRFYLDDPSASGAPRQTENLAPYDFAGTNPDDTAAPFDTTGIADGAHRITALIDLTGGSRQTVDAPFSVANQAPALRWTPEGLSLQSALDGAPSQRSLTLVASDGSRADFALSSSASWASVSPSAGGTPAGISLTVDPGGLAAGTHSATLTASAAGYASASLPITLTVGGAAGSCAGPPCPPVLVDLPYQLDFEADAGGVPDAAGVGTGLRQLDPPSFGAGYIPANLAVDTGAGLLRITTTPGIAYLDVNSQDNALGVGIPAPDQVTLLSTTLVDPPAGSGRYEQAGLWFGNDEDNFDKLVVISTPDGTRIQHLQEVGGRAAAQNDSPVLNLQGAQVTLTLRIDPYTQTIASEYRINNGAATSIGSFAAPPEFFSFDAAGIDPSIGTRSFGGIFATHRNAAGALTYAFDSLHVTAEPTGPDTGGGIDFTRRSYALPMPTSMVWGPDGRLYVTELMGRIHALTYDAQQRVVDDQVISALTDALGQRLTLGIEVDPASTPSNVILWVSSSSPSVNDGVPDSGMVTRLSGPNFTTVQNVITGLPRAKANHATNAIHFGPDGRLYIAQAGNTGAGAPNSSNSEFGDRAEQPLSAALLVADVYAAGFDGSCANTSDPFGPPPCDVTPYATGLRNAYDFVWHSNGQLYAPDNGLGVTGTFPPASTPPCTGFGDTRLWSNGGDNPGPQPDLLHRVEPGMYYGHPNPSRQECVFKDGHYQYAAPLPNYVPPFLDLGEHTSSDGMIEYTSNAACGALKGELLIANYSVGDEIIRVRLSPDGRSVVSHSRLAGGFNDPLPLAMGPDGVIFVGEFGANLVTALTPVSLGCWGTVAPAPEAVLDAGSAVLGGRLYMVGGKTAAAGHVSSLYIYDPAADLWTRGPDLPGAGVENPAVASFGGKLYVFGGATAPFSGAVRTAAVYDPLSGGWRTLASMPTARGGAAAGALDGRIYVAGGMDAGGASLASVDVYDPASDSWRSAPAMGTPRDNPGAAVLDGELYVFGGRTRRADGTVVEGTLASVEAFDPTTGSWRARAAMPTGRRTMVVGLLNGRAQLIGGEVTASGGAFAQNEEYEPLTDTWRTLAPLPTARHGAAGGTIGDATYVAGGGPSGGTAYTSVTERFGF